MGENSPSTEFTTVADKGVSLEDAPSFAQVEASLAEAGRNILVADPNERISEDKNLRPVCVARQMAPERAL